MSIRVSALYVVITGLCLYAWKDWFKSLCGLLLIMAVIHHEDMPTNMFGIQGFNVWNILFLMIVFAWAAARQHEGLKWDIPRHVVILLLLYLAVVVIGVLRAIFDRRFIQDTLVDLISDQLINTIKWVLPGILLFDGCRTRRRVLMALGCLLAMYVLLSVQIIRRMPLESALGGSGEDIALIRLKVCEAIGYSAPDMSTMLAGASWGMLAALPLIRKKKYWIAVLGAAGVIAFGQALTGGRAGYAAWVATGLVLCILKWRKYLLLAPVAVILLPILLPGVAERMLFGFGQKNAMGQAVVNDYKVTSGRTLIWPHVIDKIGESPVIGYGRLAMERTGLTNQLLLNLGESFPHPHNMYFEALLDNGILGSIPIFIFWGMMTLYVVRLFRGDNRLYSAVGGLALSLVFAQLFAGIGAQHFYPKESTVCVWAAMFLALRVYVEEARVQASLTAADAYWDGQRFLSPAAGMSGSTYGATEAW
jgi:O-antigen ligase